MFQLREINQIERDAPRVGTQRRSCHAEGVRGHDLQGFCRSGSLPYIHPTINEEVDSTTHCQPLHRPVEYEPIAVVRVAVSFATQQVLPPPPRDEPE